MISMNPTIYQNSDIHGPGQSEFHVLEWIQYGLGVKMSKISQKLFSADTQNFNNIVILCVGMAYSGWDFI